MNQAMCLFDEGHNYFFHSLKDFMDTKVTTLSCKLDAIFFLNRKGNDNITYGNDRK